jgi:hypothetical protein
MASNFNEIMEFSQPNCNRYRVKSDISKGKIDFIEKANNTNYLALLNRFSVIIIFIE